MTYIGIDPALREKGLAVCFIADKVITFEIYKSFIDFIIDVPKWAGRYTGIKIMIEVSSKQNVTFNRETSHRAALAISRNVGMNQAASIIITQLCKHYQYETKGISPKQKGSKWTANLMNLIIKDNQFLTSQTKYSQDEIDAFTLAYILISHEKAKGTVRRWHK